MTCNEFLDAVESLTASQLVLMRTEDEQMSAHARECAACGKLLEAERLLGSALQSLHARTARREASPRVGRAVLAAFRTQGFGAKAALAPDRAAPAAWKLSRFFEYGAYAAVAAALMVGIFLGARMWRDRQMSATRVQAPAITAPPQTDSGEKRTADNNPPDEAKPMDISRKVASPARIRGEKLSARKLQENNESATSASTDRQGFVALMFCDPLICSGDEQVIRMELPSTGTAADGNSSQPVVADVVVGDDGLVRAMRIVN